MLQKVSFRYFKFLLETAIMHCIMKIFYNSIWIVTLLKLWRNVSVQFSYSVVSDSLRPHGLQHTRPPHPSPTPRAYSNSCSSNPPNHLILCCPLLLLPLIFLSIRVFSNESVLCIKWPKYWSLSFRISPSSKYSGLISFTMDWFDLHAVQGTLKSLLQHNSKASILQHSTFLTVQLLHPYLWLLEKPLFWLDGPLLAK